MKKRLFSIVLSLCMVLALMPQMVFAEEGTATELQNMLNKGDTVTLNKDYTITSTIEVNNTVTLDLNGHVITMTGIGSVIKVNSGGNLTLQDSDSTAEHDDTTLPAGGVITNYYPGAEGRGVLLDGGSFTMNGGTIYNCRSGNGGGVCVQNNGSFEMTGGAISKCFSGASGGGGVYVNNGSFTMTGGAICYCFAEAAGGGVCVQNNGSFEMTGGAIYDCVARYGGGVAVVDSSFTMNGGSIFDCNAYENGSAAGVGIDSIVNANGGTIKGTIFSDGQIQNTADSGGCTVIYGEITGNGTVDSGSSSVTFKNGDRTYATEILKNGGNAIEPEIPVEEGYEFAGWYNGDTKYDFTQNVTENITLAAHWKSVEAPVITGLENGKTYCDAVEFEVTDNVAIASVKAGNEALTAGTDGKYTLEKGIGTVKVVAKDNANNETSVTVTVNNGHTYGAWQSNGDGKHIRYCTVDGCDGYEDGKCTGGEATCTSKATCEYCGEKYGELDSSNHSLENIHAKDATVTETGNKEYWQCENCKKFFADENGTDEITLDDTVISKLSPEIIEGMGQSITEGEKKALTFRSNALFEDFKSVKLDGDTLDTEYYTAESGSIIVTLDADYVATLPAGEHTIGIVSESGTATTTFTVAEKAAPGTSDDSDKDSESDKDSVKTGDDTNLALWLALMILAGAGITGTTIYTRRKRTNE